MDELNVKRQIHRYEVTYQRRAYTVEYRIEGNGASLYVYDGHELIYDANAGGRCLKRGEEIALAYRRYRQQQRERDYDSWLR